MDMDGGYKTSPSSSLEKGANNDPFRSYLSTGNVEFMMENNITTPENRCPRDKRWSYVRSRNVLLQCDDCPYETLYRHDLKRHIKRHVNPSHSCKDCNMPFNCSWALKKHVVEAHGIGETSNKNSGRPVSFKKHTHEAHSINEASNKKRRRPLKCDMCEFTTEHDIAFWKHKNRHLADGAFHCKYCNYPFTRHSRMCFHIKKKHGYDNSSKYGKTRSERTTDVESLLDGVRKAKVMLERKKEHVNNGKGYVDNNEETAVMLKHRYIATGEEFKQSESVRGVEFNHREYSTEDASTDIEHTESALVDSLQERFINYLNCVFCGYVATSYADLKEHLDVHDNEYARTDTDNVNGLFLSPESSPEVIDNDFNDNIYAGDGNTVRSIHDKVMNNDFVHLETKNESDEMYIATKYIPSQEQIDMTTPSTQQEEPSVDSTGEEEEDSKDAMIMYGNCVSKVGKIPEDEFIMKPFACSKCFYTTGNVDHLKIHVEAHLYEKAREAYNVAKRRVVVVTHIGSDGYNVDERADANNNVSKCVDDTLVPEEGDDMETEDMDNTINDVHTQNAIASSEENITSNTNVTVIDTDEGFCDKDSECNPDKDTHSGGEEQQLLNYIGRLSKEEFRKTKRLYKTFTDGDSRRTYECSICASDNCFQNQAALKEHFRLKHMDLRERLCTSCKHCSKPFP